MSHPKNTTGSSPAQHQMLTTTTDFSITDGEDRSPFSVTSGIPVADALNMATGLLGALQCITTACIDRGPDVNDVVAIRFLSLASQALIVASMSSVEFGNRQGGEA